MKKNVGYECALKLGRDELLTKSPEEVVKNTGVFWNGEEYEIPWFGKRIPLSSGGVEEQIIWLHYLNAKGPRNIAGVYINYKQVPGAGIYNDNYIKRGILPMVKCFSRDLEDFLKRGETLGGKRTELGHMAFTLLPLPYVPVTYIIWQGDDEVPAEGNIIFDETAKHWFCAEDLVVIASLPVYMMIKKDTRYF